MKYFIWMLPNGRRVRCHEKTLVHARRCAACIMEMPIDWFVLNEPEVLNTSEVTDH